MPENNAASRAISRARCSAAWPPEPSHPGIIANVTTTTGTAPDLAPKVQAMQQAGNVQIQLVLTGTDGLSAGIQKGLWYNLKPYYTSFFPGLMSNYSPGAASMASLAQDQGIEIVWYPSGSPPRESWSFTARPAGSTAPCTCSG